MKRTQENVDRSPIMSTQDGGFVPCRTVMTEEELIPFMRIREISNASDHRHVV